MPPIPQSVGEGKGGKAPYYLSAEVDWKKRMNWKRVPSLEPRKKDFHDKYLHAGIRWLHGCWFFVPSMYRNIPYDDLYTIHTYMYVHPTPIP